MSVVENSILYRFIRPWLYLDWVYRCSRSAQEIRLILTDIWSFKNDAIENCKKKLNEKHKTKAESQDSFLSADKRRCIPFLDHLVIAEKMDKSITLEEIEGEVDNVTTAAIDTISISLSYALYELSRHPEIQNKVVDELESIYDESLSKIVVKPEDIGLMTYMDMVIKETLRLHTVVPITARWVEDDVPLVSCDFTLPAGAQLVLGYLIPHRSPAFYPNPEEFNPENFLPERVKMRHPYSFLPFSAGARSCIGKKLAMMEMKAVLAKLIWELEFLPVPTYVPKEEWGLTLKPGNGVKLRVRERRK